MFDFARLVREKKTGLTYESCRRRVDQYSPQILITVTARREDEELVILGPDATYPKKKMEDDGLTLLMERTEVSFKALQQLHKDIHTRSDTSNRSFQCEKVKVSLDGVPESNAGQSVDILSLQFLGCRNVYHATIYRPVKGFKVNIDDIWKKAITDLQEADMTMDVLLADNPMRCATRKMKGATSYFACDYCEQKASVYHNPRDELPASPAKKSKKKHVKKGQGKNTDLAPRKKGKGKLHFPWIADKAKERTHDGVLKILRDHGHADQNDDVRKGIKGRSVLLDYPDFDIIVDVPCDPMHTVYKGLVDMMLQLPFKMGSQAARPGGMNVGYRLDASNLSRILRTCAVPKEFSRRTR